MLRLALLMILATAPAGAAEIVFRDTANPPRGALLRLGDIADVRGVGATRLANLPLMPKPAPGEGQLLSAQAVREMLAAQGETIADHRFEGAYFVRIATPSESSAAPATVAAPETATNFAPVRWRASALPARQNTTAFRVRPNATNPAQPFRRIPVVPRVTRSMRNDAEALVLQAVQAAIDEVRRPDEDGARLAARGVTLSDTATLELLQLEGSPVKVELGDSPRLAPGERSIRFWPESRGRGDAFRAVADLVRQPTRLVAAAPIQRGAMIVASMTRRELVPLDLIDRPQALGYTQTAQAVGREATRLVRAGDVLSEGNTSPPVMAQRGEEVVVSSGGRGVSVRIQAVAEQDGRQGELIPIKTADGLRLMARVVGPRRLAVLSGGANTIDPNTSVTGGVR